MSSHVSLSAWTVESLLIWISNISDWSSPICLCPFMFPILVFNSNWACYVVSLIVPNLSVWCDWILPLMFSFMVVWFVSISRYIYIYIYVCTFTLDSLLFNQNSVYLIFRKVLTNHFSRFCFLQIFWMIFFSWLVSVILMLTDIECYVKSPGPLL